MTTDRNALLARIRAIASRTEERGCTEAEALAAADMLTKLLSEHGLSMTDVEIGEERCGIQYLETGRKSSHESAYCMMAIAELTDCKCWQTRSTSGNGMKAIAYFGLPGDVETAVYLTRVIKASMDRELVDYIRRASSIGEPTGRRTNHAFLMGMVSRICTRLRTIKANERATATSATGRDLVVVKGAVVRQQFAELGIHLRSSGSRSSSIGDVGAYRSGQAAGDRVSFNRGIGQAGGTALLESRS